MYTTTGWGRASKGAAFQRLTLQRSEGGQTDVTFRLKYCGVCHSDVHIADNDLGTTKYPCVPGHELAGVVTRVGREVSRVKVGDHVGVGCMVDSCGACRRCEEGDEMFCESGYVSTYNGVPRYGNCQTDSGHTYGGYTAQHTVPERFIIKIPAGYPLEAAGPVFCAGITVFTPLVNNGADKGGKRVGVVGIGGLGQMGVQLAKAMGNTVTAISTSPSKEAAAKEIGADNFVVSTDPKSLKAAAGSLDLIINTVSADHDINIYLPLLAAKGVCVQLGLALKPHSINQLQLLARSLTVSGSIIGGVPNTQRVIDFCHEHNIRPKVKLITDRDLDRVYQELSGKNDSIFR